MDEKEQAILALGLLAKHTGWVTEIDCWLTNLNWIHRNVSIYVNRISFSPYLQPCLEAVHDQLKLVNSPKIVIKALAQFIVSLYQLNDVEAAQNAVSVIVPRFAQELRIDKEIDTATGVFEAFGDVMDIMKGHALFNDEMKNRIFDCIYHTFASKIACQFNETGNDENDDSEYLIALRDLTGDVFAKFGRALLPQEFESYFGRVLQLLLANPEKTRDDYNERSLVYCTLSQCFSALREYTANWIDTLLPLFLTGLQDDFREARQDAVFGIGEMILLSGDKAHPHFPIVLQSLSQLYAIEKDDRVLDNVCGSLARLIISNSGLVPLDQVIPLLAQKIPLRKCFKENKAVFKAFHLLLMQNIEDLLHVLEAIVLAAHALDQNEHKDDGEYQLIIFIQLSYYIFNDVTIFSDLLHRHSQYTENLSSRRGAKAS